MGGRRGSLRGRRGVRLGRVPADRGAVSRSRGRERRPRCAITGTSGAGRPTSRRPTTGWWRPGRGRAGRSGSRRAITLEGAAVACEYELETGGDQALPILWSMHALLALEPGSRIVLEPGGEARVTHHEGFRSRRSREVAWPGSATALDVVLGVGAGGTKLYLDARSLTRVAARATDGSELRFAWDRAFAPTLGIWLDYGGWPPGNRATRSRSSRRRPQTTTWHRRSRRGVRGSWSPARRCAGRCGWSWLRPRAIPDEVPPGHQRAELRSGDPARSLREAAVGDERQALRRNVARGPGRSARRRRTPSRRTSS